MSNTPGRHNANPPRSAPTQSAPAAPPASPHPFAAAPETLPSSEAMKLLQLDVERLIDAYEIDVMCHACKSVYQRSIGWLRMQSTMECTHCQATIVLRTSVMNDEMRRVARQLRKLQQQLGEMIERAVGILGQ